MDRWTHTHTHFFLTILHSSLSSLSSHSFAPSLTHLFVVFHLPALFECINQSSCGATAITHLVRIRETENERESVEKMGQITEWGSNKKGEREKERSGNEERKWRKSASCSVFIHLLKSLHTSRLFISLTSIHSSIHSLSQQPAMHPIIALFINAAASLPSHIIMHPSFYPSFDFPFHPVPHHSSISPSLHLYLTLSLWAFLIYLYQILLLFGEHGMAQKQNSLLWGVRYCAVLLLSNGVQQMCGGNGFFFLKSRTKSLASV